jgi:predicted short-subunit dehydrogenase-like oxidoreductase (DUF2520 family)
MGEGIGAGWGPGDFCAMAVVVSARQTAAKTTAVPLQRKDEFVIHSSGIASRNFVDDLEVQDCWCIIQKQKY